MKLHVDKKADALYLRLDESAIIESEEVSPGGGGGLQRKQRSGGRGDASSFGTFFGSQSFRFGI